MAKKPKKAAVKPATKARPIAKKTASKSRKAAAKTRAPAPKKAARKSTTKAPARKSAPKPSRVAKSVKKTAKPSKYQLKTRETAVDVDAFIAALDSPLRRDQARRAVDMLRRVTGEEPKMWGPSIVGFGKYAYTYDSGHSGEMCVAGFSPRKAQFVFYLIGHPPESDALWARLGKYQMGKSCLYVKRFEDIDLGVLEELATRSVAAIRARYPAPRAA